MHLLHSHRWTELPRIVFQGSVRTKACAGYQRSTRHHQQFGQPCCWWCRVLQIAHTRILLPGIVARPTMLSLLAWLFPKKESWVGKKHHEKGNEKFDKCNVARNSWKEKPKVKQTVALVNPDGHATQSKYTKPLTENLYFCWAFQFHGAPCLWWSTRVGTTDSCWNWQSSKIMKSQKSKDLRAHVHVQCLGTFPCKFM